MISWEIVEPVPGQRWIHIVEETHPDGSPAVGREIPLAQVASWRELLGIDDPAEVLKAIIHVQDNGEPEPDPETGALVWAQPYQVLQAREQAREDAAAETEKEGSSRSQVLATAHTAARSAVHEPIDGGECLLDRVRRDTRSRLGVAHPAKKCGAETRTTFSAAARTTDPLTEIFTGQEEYLLECTQNFLHSLTDYDQDPLIEDPQVPPAPLTLDDIKQKYGAA